MKEQSGYLSRQKNFIFLFALFLSTRVFAQVNPLAVGAVSWGAGNATVADAGVFSVVSNIAGLGGNKELAIFSAYDSHYSFSGLSTLAFGGILPLSPDLSTGFSIQRFGDKLYNEINMGIGAGHRIGRYSLGVKINLLQTAINGTTLAISRKAFVIEFGGRAELASGLFFGAHIYNMTQSSYSGIYGNRVPTWLRAGFMYEPLQTVKLSTEIEKNTDLPASFKTGLAYQILGNIVLRTGIATKPLTNHFGAGLKSKRFSVDYAAHSGSQLGWSHHFSLIYSFKRMEQTTSFR